MASKPAHVLHDTLDDRREVIHLLASLSPQQRIAWLQSCCRAVPPSHKLRPRVSRKTLELTCQARWDSSADEKVTLHCFADLWALCMNYGLDMNAALDRLVKLARLA